jgi:hypothetical protein
MERRLVGVLVRYHLRDERCPDLVPALDVDILLV